MKKFTHEMDASMSTDDEVFELRRNKVRKDNLKMSYLERAKALYHQSAKTKEENLAILKEKNIKIARSLMPMVYEEIEKATLAGDESAYINVSENIELGILRAFETLLKEEGFEAKIIGASKYGPAFLAISGWATKRPYYE